MYKIEKNSQSTQIIKKKLNSNELVDILGAHDIVTHYIYRMFFYLLSAGIIVLQRKYLPPSLVSPTDLQLILKKNRYVDS